MYFYCILLLWMMNVVGGGDVKLIGALFLGVHSEYMLLAMIAIGLLGGIQILLMWMTVIFVKLLLLKMAFLTQYRSVLVDFFFLSIPCFLTINTNAMPIYNRHGVYYITSQLVSKEVGGFLLTTPLDVSRKVSVIKLLKRS